jgi:hypothetical protein
MPRGKSRKIKKRGKEGKEGWMLRFFGTNYPPSRCMKYPLATEKRNKKTHWEKPREAEKSAGIIDQ